jgi:hypothetical protein
MSDHPAQRPTKQRKMKGPPFLPEMQPLDDDISSTASSSSSEAVLPLQSQPHNLSNTVVFGHNESFIDRDRAVEGHAGDAETTTSSESEESSEEGSAEVTPSDEEEEMSQGERVSSGLARVPGQMPSITSRLQNFLPRLQQANAELEQEEDLQRRRVDDVPEGTEHYIEMDLSLGVLSEQGGDRDVGLGGEDGDSQDSYGEGIEVQLSSADKEEKSTKRKIEEMD